MSTYILCGISSISSCGVCIGALSALAPSRMHDIIKHVVWACVAGNIACLLTGCVAGKWWSLEMLLWSDGGIQRTLRPCLGARTKLIGVPEACLQIWGLAKCKGGLRLKRMGLLIQILSFISNWLKFCCYERIYVALHSHSPHCMFHCFRPSIHLSFCPKNDLTGRVIQNLTSTITFIWLVICSTQWVLPCCCNKYKCSNDPCSVCHVGDLPYLVNHGKPLWEN